MRVVALVAVLALGLTACSDDGGSDAPKANASETPTVASDRVAPAGLPDVPTLARARGAASDVELGDCAVEAGQQSVAGTVTSTRKKPGDYVLTISWTNDRSDVRGRAVVVEKAVQPGESRDWEATAAVAAGATQCVPNVRVGRLRR